MSPLVGGIEIGGGVAIGQPQLLPMIRARTLQLLAGYIPAASARVLETLIVLPFLGKDAGPLGAIAVGERALMASARRGTKSNKNPLLTTIS